MIVESFYTYFIRLTKEGLSLYVSLGRGHRSQAVVSHIFINWSAPPTWCNTVLNSPNTDPVTLPPVVDGSTTAAVTAISKTLDYDLQYEELVSSILIQTFIYLGERLPGSRCAKPSVVTVGMLAYIIRLLDCWTVYTC